MAAQLAEKASRQISGGIEIVPFAGEGLMSERPLLFSADGGQAGAAQLRPLDGGGGHPGAMPDCRTDAAPPQMLRDPLVAYLQAGILNTHVQLATAPSRTDINYCQSECEKSLIAGMSIDLRRFVRLPDNFLFFTTVNSRHPQH